MAKEIDPDKMVAEIAANAESGRILMRALANNLWREFDGPAGLATEIGKMYHSFDGDRTGHQNQIRLLSDVVRVLSSDAAGEPENDNEQTIEDIQRELDEQLRLREEAEADEI